MKKKKSAVEKWAAKHGPGKLSGRPPKAPSWFEGLIKASKDPKAKKIGLLIQQHKYPKLREYYATLSKAFAKNPPKKD